MNGWDLAAIRALVPSAPHASPVSGTLSAHADVRGTLGPWSVETNGQGQLSRFQAGPMPLGDVPFRWATDRDAVVVSGIEAHPFGGRLAAEVRVPVGTGKPTEGSASFTAIDTAQLTAAIPGQGLKLTGKADGQVRFSIPADVSALEATVGLSAPELTMQGIPAEQVHAAVRAHQGTLRYEVTADSLGGKIKFKGDFPLNSAPAPATASGEFRAVGFKLAQLWKALGITGTAAQLGGLGAIDANFRDTLSGTGAGLWAHGVAEFRNLSWGKNLPLGQLRGIVALSPTTWRIEPLNGELLGGLARGFAWGSTPAQGPRQIGFEFRIDRAALSRVLAFLPDLARNLEGLGSLRVAGNLDEVFRAAAEVVVTQARFARLPLSEVRAPAEVVLMPETGSGVIHVRSWSARLAGGQLRGDITLRLGDDRSFQTLVQLSSLDLQSLARIESDAARPASGKISGRITLSGTDPAQPQRYRGKVVLNLDDASLVALPVFREIDRFLGAAGRAVRRRRAQWHDRQQATHRRAAHPGRPPGAAPRRGHGRVRRPVEPGGADQHEPDHPRDRPGAGRADPRPP